MPRKREFINTKAKSGGNRKQDQLKRRHPDERVSAGYNINLS